jgi:hypothetical protein
MFMNPRVCRGSDGGLFVFRDNRLWQAGTLFPREGDGMRDRIFGPYPSRSQTIECFDVVLDGILDAYMKCLEEGESVMG